jgi:DNA repair exonuclease SbcCD ATPase subunit
MEGDMTDPNELDIEVLEIKYKQLIKRKESLQKNKSDVSAELAARRRELQKLMDECKEMGFDPNNLGEEIRKHAEILSLKVDNFEADIDMAEKVLRPMLEEIRGDRT